MECRHHLDAADFYFHKYSKKNCSALSEAVLKSIQRGLESFDRTADRSRFLCGNIFPGNYFIHGDHQVLAGHYVRSILIVINSAMINQLAIFIEQEAFLHTIS